MLNFSNFIHTNRKKAVELSEIRNPKWIFFANAVVQIGAATAGTQIPAHDEAHAEMAIGTATGAAAPAVATTAPAPIRLDPAMHAAIQPENYGLIERIVNGKVFKRDFCIKKGLKNFRKSLPA